MGTETPYLLLEKGPGRLWREGNHCRQHWDEAQAQTHLGREVSSLSKSEELAFTLYPPNTVCVTPTYVLPIT